MADAFITFSNYSEAKKAVDDNFSVINHTGIQIQVSWLIFNSYNQHIVLQLNNLPLDIDELQLQKTLEIYGSISCRIPRDIYGKSKGVAYVHFANSDDAQTTMDVLQNAEINGNVINVGLYRARDKILNTILKLPPNIICIQSNTSSLDFNNYNFCNVFSKFGKILDSFPLSDYYFIIFENPRSASHAIAEFYDPQFTIVSSVKKDIYTSVLRASESKRVFITELLTDDKSLIIEHLQKVAKVVFIDVYGKRDSSDIVCFAQFESESERNKVIKELDKTTIDTRGTPIRILPYLEKRLEHPYSGLLQLNELPGDITYSKIRQQLSIFGDILSIYISPVSDGSCIGYVLFGHYPDAVTAHKESGIINTYLYQPLDPNDILSGFSDNNKGRVVAWYNIPETETEITITDKFHQNGIKSIVDLWISNNGNSRTAFITLSDLNNVINALNFLRSIGFDCQLYGFHMMVRTYKLLSKSNKDVHDRTIYVTDIGSKMTNKKLRETFETVGAVESAMMFFDPVTGEPDERAIIVFKELHDAIVSLNKPPNSTYNITKFKVKEQQHSYESEIYIKKNGNISNPCCFRPREIIKNCIVKSVNENEVKKKLLDEITNETIEKCFELANDVNLMNEWIKKKTNEF
ncbi:polyadenylate-binding protein [Histomonas meleagridis]|uniref:polyadenylate-binding protein n=1 Tax=Histomonas meleagridis TaxID=135588 RepID=UPI003559A883|nr:polyadenylate-binding protein [Histomonas meleagridis]KAH0805317.1 polyadenylate-binding protein [Histomonas meleagridis]